MANDEQKTPEFISVLKSNRFKKGVDWILNSLGWVILAVLLISFGNIIYQSYFNAQKHEPIPIQLRAGSFPCDKVTIDTALALKQAGWVYIMPQPKSPQANWGNMDGRTTWWIGYWINNKNHETSSTQPQTNEWGQFIGDGKGFPDWRRGGTPLWPTKIEWLCSQSGGIEPIPE